MTGDAAVETPTSISRVADAAPAVRRAEWRARRDDPRGPLGWAWQDLGATARTVGTTLERTFQGGALLLVLHGHWYASAVAMAFASAPPWIAKGLDRLRRRVAVDDLVALPSPATPFPCRIEVLLRGGALLGKDMGVVTFVDGWMLFEGRRTAFAARRTDVESVSDGQIVWKDGGELVFHPEDRLKVGDLLERGLRERFLANLASWGRSASPKGDSCLPPDRAHPSGLARGWSDLAATAALTLLAVVPVERLASRYGPSFLVLFLPLVLAVVRAGSRLNRARHASAVLGVSEERTVE